MSYTGKTALITGGAFGIGLAFCKYFGERGSRLVVVDNAEDKLKAAEAELKGLGFDVVTYSTDLASLDAVKDLCSDLESKNIPVDYLVNNVGIGHYSMYTETPWERLEMIMDVNLRAMTYLCYAILPQMLERDSGTIINLSSTGAFCGAYKSAIYTATKAFTTNFTEALDMEVAKTNVRTLTAHPGATDTNFWYDAETNKSPQFNNVKLMTPEETVAEFMGAYENGKASIIAGWQNRLMVFAAKFVPRELLKTMALKKYGG